jgi:hypothetical protein
MKQIFLYFFLLITPLQERQPISLDDILSIGSMESFQRVMVENGFDFVRNYMNSEFLTSMGMEWDPNTMGDSIYQSIYYYGWNEVKDDPLIYVTIVPRTAVFNIYISDDSIFDSILSETRKRCNFYGMLWDGEFSGYSCPEAEFADGRYLSFTRNSSNSSVTENIFDGSVKVNHIKIIWD